MKKLLNLSISLLFACILLFNFQSCALLGFGAGAIADKKKITEDQTVMTEEAWRVEPGSKIEIVDKGGIIYRGSFEKIEAIKIYSGELQRVVWLKSDGTLKPVLLDNIDRITIPGKKKNGKWTGLVVGAVIDAVIITAVSLKIQEIERNRKPVHICFWSSNCSHHP